MNLKIITTALIIFLIASLAAVFLPMQLAKGDANDVVNGGFEASLDNWGASPFVDHTTDTYISNWDMPNVTGAQTHSGGHAITFSSVGTMALNQSVNIAYTSAGTVGAWSKDLNAGGYPNDPIVLEVFYAESSVLQTSYGIGLINGETVYYPLAADLVNLRDGNTEWHFCQDYLALGSQHPTWHISMIRIEPLQTYNGATYVYHSLNGYGNLYVDDISLQSSPSPTPTPTATPTASPTPTPTPTANPNYKNVTFQSTAGGSIAWIDHTSPYHDGSTTTQLSVSFPNYDSITITATPDVNSTFQNFIYAVNSYETNITTNPLNIPSINASFIIQAVFTTPNTYHAVTFSNAGTWAFITWNTTTQSGNAGTYSFLDGTNITVKGNAATGYHFLYFLLAGGKTGMTTINSQNIIVNTAFSITEYVVSDSSPAYVWVNFVTTGDGTLSWIDNTSPYHDGATTTNTTQRLPFGDQISITATPTSHSVFQNFIYTDSYGTGNLTLNPIDAPPITENFTINAVFEAATNYYLVTLSNGDDGANATWTLGTEMGGVGDYLLPAGTILTLNGGANDGYVFDHWSLGGFGTTGLRTDNPLIVNVSGYMLISESTHVIPQSAYAFTLLQRDGGTATWQIVGNASKFSYGTYVLPAGAHIQLTAKAFDNYIFGSWGTMANPITDNPTVITLNRNTTQYANFQTDSLTISVFPPPEAGSTSTNFNLKSGRTYQVQGRITENISTTDNSGFFAVLATPISPNPNIANTGKYFHYENGTIFVGDYKSIIYGNFTNGQISFSMFTYNYSTPQYMGLSILVLFNGTVINHNVFQVGSTAAVLSFLSFMTGNLDNAITYATNPALFVYQGAQISYSYHINYLTSMENTPATTATPPIVPSEITDILWSSTAKLIYGCIVLIGACLGFAFLLGRGNNGAALQGVMIGLITSLIVNMLAFAWSPWNLFVIVTLLIYLIIDRVRPTGGG
jgi:hypothetical protein